MCHFLEKIDKMNNLSNFIAKIHLYIKNNQNLLRISTFAIQVNCK